VRIFILLITVFMFASPVFAQDSGSISAAESGLSAIYNSTTNMADITVSVENGVVTLTGDVANSDVAEKAVEIAQSRDGIVYVQDQLNRALVGENNVTDALGGLKQDINEIQAALPIICLALLTFLLMCWLGGFVARRKAFWQKISPNPFLAELLSQTIRVIFIIGGLIIALNFLGAQAFITTILGGAGVVGIALGFAVRDTLENYLASIMLSLRQPFRAGDHVLIGDREGKVMRLTSRATILMTMDGNHLRIPNSTVFKAVILNYTTNPDRRFTFSLGVDAADDPVMRWKRKVSHCQNRSTA